LGVGGRKRKKRKSANQQIYIRRSLEDWNELGSNK
jgi:hypothetical protein